MLEAGGLRVRQANARLGIELCGKWRLDRVLGVGGMAAVYAASHRNGKHVAIKLLHPDLSMDESSRARFVREGYVANAIKHPGAVSILDDDVASDGSVFIVMELLDGETLDARRVRCGALEANEVLAITDQLLDVLGAAHDVGIVHRDMKPENVFMTVQGEVKILDFGIARLREPDAGQHTTLGASMGTPAYMPPEQALGHWDRVDGRTDLWSVGATMFEMLTGSMVHVGTTVNELLLGAMTKHARPIRTVLPTVPDAVADIVDRALAFSPEDRYPSAQAMQDAVRAALRTLPPPPSLSTPRAVAMTGFTHAASSLGEGPPGAGTLGATSRAKRREAFSRTGVIVAVLAGMSVALSIAYLEARAPERNLAVATDAPAAASAASTPASTASGPLAIAVPTTAPPTETATSAPADVAPGAPAPASIAQGGGRPRTAPSAARNPPSSKERPAPGATSPAPAASASTNPLDQFR